MEEKKRIGAKFVCELPEPGPWKMLLWQDGVLAVSPHHHPRFLRADGTVTVLDAVPPGL